MSLITLTGETANKYRSFLQTFRDKMGKEPTASERTEAFFCARSKDPWELPVWCKTTNYLTKVKHSDR